MVVCVLLTPRGNYSAFALGTSKLPRTKPSTDTGLTYPSVVVTHLTLSSTDLLCGITCAGNREAVPRVIIIDHGQSVLDGELPTSLKDLPGHKFFDLFNGALNRPSSPRRCSLNKLLPR